MIVGPPEGHEKSIFANWKLVHMLQSQKPGFFKLVTTGKLRVEAVLLTPGTELYVIGSFCMLIADYSTCSHMQPNTPHAVLTPDSSICHGGHYHSTSTIRQTCYGVFIGFVFNSIITNTEHTSAALLFFRRLTEYWNKVYRCSEDSAGM